LNQIDHYKAVKARLGMTPTRNVVARPQARVEPPKPVKPAEPKKEVKTTKPEHRTIIREHRRDRTITIERYVSWWQTNQPKMETLAIPATVRRILTKVCKKYNMTPEQAFFRTRLQCVTKVRFECFFALYANGFGYGEIGRMLNRDHTTVMHGAREWKEKFNGQYTDYVADPRSVARRLSLRLPNVAKHKARAEIYILMDRLGALATGSSGSNLNEDGSHPVGELV
jgi:hypothetical protein